MKKVISFILVLLPIFLMVFISIAGQIFAEYIFIPAEGVMITDSEGAALPYSAVIKVGKTANAEEPATTQAYYKVLPERATNKNVSFLIRNTNIATVDDNGIITGLDYGSTELVITTQSGGHSSTVRVSVTDEAVTEVLVGFEKNSSFVEINSYTISVGETFTFKAEIIPYTALNKAVSWKSSNSGIARVSGGVVTAVAEGTCDITVTSRDGGKTATFTLTVAGNDPLFASKYTEVQKSNSGTFDLFDFIVFNETQIARADIEFRIVGGISYATIDPETKILTVNKTLEVILIYAEVNYDGIRHRIELRFAKI